MAARSQRFFGAPSGPNAAGTPYSSYPAGTDPTQPYTSEQSGETRTLMEWADGYEITANPDGTVEARTKFSSGIPPMTLRPVIGPPKQFRASESNKVFNFSFGGMTFCIDDALKSTEGGHRETHLNDCEGGDGHQYDIVKMEACKDRSNPTRNEGQHYFRLTHRKPCEPCDTNDDDCDCYEGWERVGSNLRHKGYNKADTTAAENALEKIRKLARQHGLQWKGCMDVNASNYDKDAVCPDPNVPCVCNVDQEMNDDGLCVDIPSTALPPAIQTQSQTAVDTGTPKTSILQQHGMAIGIGAVVVVGLLGLMATRND